MLNLGIKVIDRSFGFFLPLEGRYRATKTSGILRGYSSCELELLSMERAEQSKLNNNRSVRFTATVDKQSYEAAVQHQFLQSARSQTLSSGLLSFWLSQDRIYAAHAYPRFIGALIAKIPFSSKDKIDGTREARNQRILALLTYSLENVVREAGFFLQTARKYDLDLEIWKERPATKAYCAEMARVANWGSLEEGLVFLYYMEKLYLDAWSFVASGLSEKEQEAEQSKTSKAVREFARNWTSEEFIKFVDDLAAIVDEIEAEEHPELEGHLRLVCERVVELEVEFWPQEGEEVKGRLS